MAKHLFPAVVNPGLGMLALLVTSSGSVHGRGDGRRMLPLHAAPRLGALLYRRRPAAPEDPKSDFWLVSCRQIRSTGGVRSTLQHRFPRIL